MSYLNTLVNSVKSNSTIKRIRNQLNIRPSYASMADVNTFNFYSDLFPWRQDRGFTTTFRLSNPFAVYEKNKSVEVSLNIFNRDGALEGNHIFETSNKSISLNLDDFLSPAFGEYGTFEVFLQPTAYVEQLGTNFVNRCYVGFKHKHTETESFCHGNFISKRLNKNSSGEWVVHGDVVTKTLFETGYWIQKQFDMAIKNELFFSNGSNQKSWISINSGEKHYLPSNASLILEVKEEIVIVKSDLALPRPIIFSYTDQWLDCHHA